MDATPQTPEQIDPPCPPVQLATGEEPPITPKCNQSSYGIDTAVDAKGALQMKYEEQTSDELIVCFTEVLSGGSGIQLYLQPGWTLEDPVGNLDWTQADDKWFTTLTEQMLYDVVINCKEYESTFSFVDSVSGVRVDPRVRVRRPPSQEP